MRRPAQPTASAAASDRATPPPANELRAAHNEPVQPAAAAPTIEPAKLIARVPGLGTLQIGAPADVAVFDVVDGAVEFVDTRNNKRTGTRKLVPFLTVRGGRPFGRPPLPLPFTY